jgi:transposase-like protein
MEKPKTLQQAIQHFSDEQVCIDTVAALRWADGKPTCPACQKQDHYYLKTQKRWKCKECGRQFSVKLGTIFEDSPLSLDKWLTALWMIVNCRNGISSYEVGRDLAITQKSAWFVLHRLRMALQDGSITKLGSKDGGEVEVDETFIGGKARFMHRAKRERLSRDGGMQGGAHGKAVVMGLLERGGKVKAMVIPHRKQNLPEKIVREIVEPGAEVHTDEYSGYYNLKDGYVHKVINHLEGYVKENIHTNGIENFWSCLKRGIGGTYIAVEPFHLFRYVDEQAFRFNHRKDAEGKKLTDGERFDAALARIGGKRLTYSELTGKDWQVPF